MRALIAGLALALCAYGIAAAQSSTTVRGYVKKDGTYVAPYQRTTPNRTTSDNYSTKGNYNPYTGEEGTKADTKPYGYTPPPAYTAPDYSKPYTGSTTKRRRSY